MTTCPYCLTEWPLTADSCVDPTDEFGPVVITEGRRCGDCGVAPGGIHHPGCDVARCLNCGHQAISCGCGRDGEDEPRPDADRIYGFDRWTGEWPGDVECRELDWWSYFGPDADPPQQGWIQCERDHPGATEDLNRLGLAAARGEVVWVRAERRFRKVESDG